MSGDVKDYDIDANDDDGNETPRSGEDKNQPWCVVDHQRTTSAVAAMVDVGGGGRGGGGGSGGGDSQ